ncbi:DUF1918 domain-containing protein [Frankia nepalensis]|nr:DUF1918 domain-containing protein [Frankia nepalensis]
MIREKTWTVDVFLTEGDGLTRAEAVPRSGTDRDLALRAVARRVPHDGRIDAVMTTGVVTLPVTAGRDEQGRGQARVGDQVVTGRHAAGEPDRDGEILEVHSPAGDPPFRVRWADTGKVTFFYPGPDARIRHLVHH